MIVLDATTDNIQVVLGAAATANQMQCMSCWRDVTATAYTPGRTVSVTNNTTDVNVVPAPGASTQRVVDYISVYNADTATKTVTIKFDANGTEYILWKGSLASGETIQYHEEHGFQKLDPIGKVIVNPALTYTDVQVFTTEGAGTWVKPTHFTPKLTRVVCIGAGGGGGGACSGDAGTTRQGGAGGGGGAFMERHFQSSDLAVSVALSVGAGGTAGTGGTNAVGTDGGVGGDSTFGAAGATQQTGWGGGGGYRGLAAATLCGGGGGGGTGSAGATGTTSAGVAGLPGTSGTTYGAGCGGRGAGTASSVSTEYGGGGGGCATAAVATAVGSQSLFGGGGGGAGHGTNSSNTRANGSTGGIAGLIYNYIGGGRSGYYGAGGWNPRQGGDGMNGIMDYCGNGGGGGGGSASTETSGAAGGDGGHPGGGGAGGGNGTSTGTAKGGDGGVGGSGEVRVYSW